jgi:hypothetical protein
LRAGDPLISIDNCEQPVGGEFLCQILTQRIVKVRILGLSETPEFGTNTMVFCTGNNLTVSGDMARRVILCSLDPKEERPELREFERSPTDIIKADRGRYVHAALTILRAYRQATEVERPGPFASFGELEELVTVLTEWDAVISTERMSVAQIIKTATKSETTSFDGSKYTNSALRDALLAVAGAGGDISAKRLGKWLTANKDRIVDGRLISKDSTGGHAGVANWKLIKRKAAE